ncbi:MAG: hypothetical protein KDA38_00900 [Planctomycetales bacterium]|nr:hypothetical protein [Planctomycetales bacterium]
MNDSPRRKRLAEDLVNLRQLDEASSILEVQCEGDLPDRYTLQFRGRGLATEPRPGESIAYVELHRVDLRLPYSYPQRPPDIRWLTPLFHPNVSFSGFINLADIGLTWNETVSLDSVCERLWDVARLAFVDLDDSTNYTARAWFADEHGLTLPVDGRPLRTQAAESSPNIIRYERRPASSASPRPLDIPPIRTALSGSNENAENMGRQRREDRDVFYINEDTPVPELPRVRRPLQGGDTDVFYIGEE